MKLILDKQENYILIQPDEDRLDTIIAPQLKSELVYLNAEGAVNVILDLEKVKFVDSSGLSAILVGNRLSRGVDGTFVICNLSNPVAKLVEISQLGGILNIAENVETAIASLNKSANTEN